VIAAASLTLSAGCADDTSEYYGTTERTGKSPTTYYVNAGAEPEFVDPGRVGEAIGSLLLNHVFEPLSVYDPRDSHPTQGVAISWDKSDDNRLFRFHLRDNALWSDGKRVTAHDFAYAWARVLRPSLRSNAATNLHVLLNGELFARGQLKITRDRTPVSRAPGDGQANVTTLPAGAAVRILKTEGQYAQIALHTRLPSFDVDRPAPAPEDSPPPLGFVPSKALMESPSVLGVRATDDDTLEVETERPAPYFLDLTCYPSLSPLRRDVVEPLEEKGGVDAVNHLENLVNNGAYSLEAWKFRYEISLKKNPLYWRASEVKIERVVWTMVEEARAMLNLYKTGELDYIGDSSSIGVEAMPFVSKKKDFIRSFYLSVYWLDFNSKRPPVDDVRVRKALNLAIDKAQIVEKVTRGGQIPATHYVPDFTGSGYAEAVAADKKAGVDPFSGPGHDFDPERARALLREAGYEVVQEDGGYKAKGFPALEMIYNTSEGHRAIAVAIQDFWRRHLGVTVALRNEEWKVFLKTRSEGDFQIARGGWIVDYNHPESWLDTFLSYSPQNFGKWSDPAYDAMVREAARTADLKESIRQFRQAEKYAVDQMPKLPLYFYTRSVLVKPWLKGFYPNPRNAHAAQWLWIDETGKAENRPAAEPREYPPPGPFSKGGSAKGPGR
jgi:oligopeptide transport system substrate-binding protein